MPNVIADIGPTYSIAWWNRIFWMSAGRGSRFGMKINLALLVALFVLFGSTGIAADRPKDFASSVLSCPLNEKDVNLDKSPKGAKRLNEHTLQVNCANEIKFFEDKPPYDEDLGGLHWHYCDYDPKSGFHLIAKQNEDLFTAVLLDNATGKVLEAGEHVRFSPDGEKYFASRQIDGMDGQEWFVRSLNGIILWEGTSEMDRLEQPSWNRSGELQAVFRCSEGKKKTARITTLTKSGKKWIWLPSLQCD